jgi:hypothetical protein
MCQALSMATGHLEVEHLFTLDVEVAEGMRVAKGGPQGTLIIAEVAGGDWVTARTDRSLQLDVRLTLVTDDDAVILMQYKGIAEPNLGVARTAPQFETGDDRYLWINNVQGVGVGTLHPEGGVTYEVYSLTQMP